MLGSSGAKSQSPIALSIGARTLMKPGFPWMNPKFDVDSSDFQGNPEVSRRRESRHGIPARGT